MCTDTWPESASLLSPPRALVLQFFTLNSQQGYLKHLVLIMALMNVNKTQEELDLNSRINLCQSHSSTTIIASGSLPLSSQPYLTRHTHEKITRLYQVSKLHCVLKMLQCAAQWVKADPSFSQLNIFFSLAPLAVFVYLIRIGVLLPCQQQFWYSKTREVFAVTLEIWSDPAQNQVRQLTSQISCFRPSCLIRNNQIWSDLTFFQEEIMKLNLSINHLTFNQK